MVISRYDERGNLVSRLNYAFEYDARNRLVQISRDNDDDSGSGGGGHRVRIFYDDKDRVVMQVKSSDNGKEEQEEEEVLHYFYGYRDSPHLVSHVHRSKATGSSFHTLHYDSRGTLIAFSNPSDASYRFVKSDQNGTPVYVFDGARMVNGHLRSPFGILIQEQDSSGSRWVPLGFHGGLEDLPSGVVVIRGRPYDTHLGQWMTPDQTKILSGISMPWGGGARGFQPLRITLILKKITFGMYVSIYYIYHLQ